MEALEVKLVTLVALMVITILCSILPYFLVLRGTRSFINPQRQGKVVAYLNCFAGGVFLGTLLLHLLPEGSEQFEEYKHSISLHIDLPIFNILLAVGFFLVAFIEYFMRSYLFKEIPDTKIEIDIPAENVTGQYGSLGSTSCPDHSSHCNHDEHKSLLDSNHIMEKSPVSSDDIMVNNPETNVKLEVKVVTNSTTPTGIRAYLLLLALSFHTMFDGLAVGLQKGTSEVWQVFTAIALHKSIIAFCLGLEVFKSQPNRPCRAFIWLCFFALMSPIGIGIGIFLTSGGVDNLARMLSSSILQGFAAGVFLYVTFLELLCVYIGHKGNGNFLSIFYSMLGFVMMVLVKLADHS